MDAFEDKAPGSPDEYASLEQTQAELRALSEADTVRLGLAAKRHFRHYALSRFFSEPRELLHEAVVATLDGSCPWRKERRSIREHLDRVMWSRAAKHVERGGVRRGELLRNAPLDDPNKAPPLPSSDPSPALAALARIELERLEALFAGNPVDLAVLRARALGLPRSAVLADTGIGKTEYETAAKRVRTRILGDLTQDGE